MSGAAAAISAMMATSSSTGGYCAVNSLLNTIAMDDSNSSLASRSRTTSEGEVDSLSSSTSSVAHQQQQQQLQLQQQQQQRSRNLTIVNGNSSSVSLDTTASSSSPSTLSCRMFLYTLDTYDPSFELFPNDTAESVCHRLCKRLNLKPIVELLFGLRTVKDNSFLPANRPLTPKSEYSFRLRFKQPDHTKLKALDKNAFEYYYMQVRHDLIHMKYPGIDYVHENEKILGLVVADMYLEMIKYNKPVEVLCKEYKRFTPKDIQRFAKPKIKETMRNIVRKDYDQYYVMESYLSQVNTIGPFYLREEYDAETDYNQLGEDPLMAPLGLASAAGSSSSSHQSAPPVGAGVTSASSSLSSLSIGGIGVIPSTSTPPSSSSRELLLSRRHFLPRSIQKQPRCALKVQLYPEYRKEPVLRIYYKHTDSARTYPIKGMNVIVIEDGRKVHVEWSDRTQLKLVLTSAAMAESLVSGLATYYRLMDRWTFDLCGALVTPSLVRLSELRCHGPIGFPAAYEKLQPLGVGYYIVRQCDKFHDTFSLDIKTSPKEVRTFKVTNSADGGWLLHRLEAPRTPERFNSLNDVARSIRLLGAGQPIRIGPPSQAGELPSLLLCQKQSETRKVMVTGDVEGEPKCINPQQLILRKETYRTMEGSALTEIWADWTIDNKTFVEVTLKALKPNQIELNMMAFLNQAQKWCKLRASRDLLRIYGVTLYNPTAMVMERTKCTLAELLKDHRPQTRLLIDVTQSLARAVNYMHSQNFVHTMIRCSTLHVAAWDDDKLVVRLGDPGINNFFTEADLPWIPVEYHNGMMKMSKLDLKTDIWAYATTLWQIFSNGRVPPRDCFRGNNYLKKPAECPDKLYQIMRKGWDRDPEKRFEPQSLFTWLYHIRQEYEHYYQPMKPSASALAAAAASSNRGASAETVSLGSMASAETEQIDLISNGNESSIGGGSSSRRRMRTTTAGEGSSVGEYSGSERSLLNYGAATESTMVPGSMDGMSLSSYLDNMPSVLESDTYKVILQGVIGSGHYGTVMQGELWYNDEESTKVAVKMIKTRNSSFNDFQNESKIMKAVDHPNIVKILDFHCEKDVAIIVEFMPRGNLGSYLTAQRYHLTVPMLLRFARDIACGMAYLQLKDIVHRDLAARNVLVAADETLKISDFGLARFVDNSGYYMVQDLDKELPIHYYAPETLEYSRYSIKSDIWSYGVTLFEIFKREEEKVILVDGDVQQLIQALHSGRRLPKSDTCPQAVYDQLMMPCWEYEKERRPTFTLILKTIDSIASEFGEPI